MRNLSFLVFLLMSFNIFSSECITYQNMLSIKLEGQLFEVKGTRYWDHGEEIKYYIFRIDQETCFDDGEEGPINTNELHVLLNNDQLADLDKLLNQKTEMQVIDFLWGGTQHWKRSIGVLKANFIYDKR